MLRACTKCKGAQKIKGAKCARCAGTGIEPLGKPNKYHAKSFVDENGERWDSQGEYKRWCDLKLLEKGGAISKLRHKVSYPLIVHGGGQIGRIVVDFVYEENGKLVADDFKGCWPALSKWKWSHFAMQYGIDVRISRAR